MSYGPLQADFDADFIVIGAGTAGCVMANRLSANPNLKILVLEAGGEDNHPWIHIPIGYLYTMNNPATDWCWRTEPDPGLNGRSLNYPRGKTLGGCSSINGMIYMRGQAGDYDHWAELGNNGWSWSDVLPYFKKSEDYFAGAGEYHGAHGEWRVEQQRLSWQVLDTVRKGAEQLGLPTVQDYNCGDNEGFSYFQVNQSRGRRWSAARGFLHPVRQRKNLQLITKAHVTHLQIEQGRASGVHFEIDGRGYFASAREEVLLTAGAVASPVLLQRSGVGPKALLEQHGITVKHPLEGVGQNLQDHLQIRTIFKLEGAHTLNQQANSWLGKAKMAFDYALFRSGPLSMAPSQLGGFAKSDPEQTRANIEYHIQPLSCDKLGDPLHDFPAITASVCDLRPKSRGYVQLTSADPYAPPAIQANYLSHPEDQKVAIDALRFTRKLFQTSALGEYQPEEYRPGVELQSDEQLLKAAGDLGTTIFHPVGTCKMGSADDPMAVVNERLKVHGLAGLRVIDASIMPTITSGNTSSPVVMIAEKASDMIFADLAHSQHK